MARGRARAGRRSTSVLVLTATLLLATGLAATAHEHGIGGGEQHNYLPSTSHVAEVGLTPVGHQPHEEEGLVEIAAEQKPAPSHEHATSSDPHSHHGAAQLYLNESAILQAHGVTPLSYYGFDTGADVELAGKYGGSRSGTMTLHVVSMSLSFFIFLPLVIYFGSAKHALLSTASRSLFLATLLLGCVSGMFYSKSTPELYKGQTHTGISWFLTFMAIALSAARLVYSAAQVLLDKGASQTRPGFLGFIISQLRERFNGTTEADSEYALLAQTGRHSVDDDYHREGTHNSSLMQHREDTFEHPPTQGHLSHEPEEMHDESAAAISPIWRRSHRQEMSVDVPAYPPSRGLSRDSSHPTHWRTSLSSPTSAPLPSRQQSGGSDETLNDNPSLLPPLKSKTSSDKYSRTISPAGYGPEEGYPPESASLRLSTSRRIAKGLVKYGEIFLWRIMIILGFVASTTGAAVYTGVCRGSYWNTCLAHVIKGSIFFWLGLLTFGRYLGAWAELGWAWNRKPSTSASSWRKNAPSFEMIECGLIWLYGATNTWMERFGAHAGDPWSTKQIQHVSIAVMYFFAGTAGIILESKTARAWIGNAVSQHADRTSSRDPTIEPPSYAANCNIFPAVCVGVTGIAMSAHHQDYVFSVTVHALWGYLLAMFAVCRLLTYTFLYLRPPTASIYPSRPPTEALAALCCAAGGIVFIVSDEEIVYWMMRHGRDDIMFVLNVTIAVVCAVFAWIVALMALKGWATGRTMAARSARRADMAEMQETL